MLAQQAARLRQKHIDGSLTSEGETENENDDLDMPRRKKQSRYSSKNWHERESFVSPLTHDHPDQEALLEEQTVNSSTHGFYENDAHGGRLGSSPIRRNESGSERQEI